MLNAGPGSNSLPGSIMSAVNRNIEALAKALGRAHAALLHDLTNLEEAAQPKSPMSRPELRARLAKAQERVLAHFRFEEQDGYMDAVRTREQRLTHTIDELASDHHRLVTALDAIVHDASVGTSADEDLRCRVREWVNELTRHELRENHVVQDAFNSDITAED
jgi:hypothetical protein